MNQAVIVGAARSAAGRAVKGSLSAVRPEEMLAQVLRATVERSGVDPERIEDVIVGCAFPEAEQGLNVARLVALKAGLPVSVSAQTVNRQCASGLQTIAMGAWQIMTGSADVVVAGGVESMSRVPIPGQVFRADPDLMEQRPGAYLNMGLTAENLAREHDISREDQDAFALRSHQRAGARPRQAVALTTRSCPWTSRDWSATAPKRKTVPCRSPVTRGFASTLRPKSWPLCGPCSTAKALSPPATAAK